MNIKNWKTPTLSKRRKLLSSLPFIISAGLLTDTWYKFYIGEYDATLKHYVTLILTVVNGVLFLIRFKQALLMNGLILTSASFSLLSFCTYTSSDLTIFGITIPFEGWSFLILIFYLAINCSILINWYLDAKEIKPIE